MQNASPELPKRWTSSIFEENETRFIPDDQESWTPIPPQALWFDWRFIIELLTMANPAPIFPKNDPYVGIGPAYKGPWKHEGILGKGINKISYTSATRGKWIWIVKCEDVWRIGGHAYKDGKDREYWLGRFPD